MRQRSPSLGNGLWGNGPRRPGVDDGEGLSRVFLLVLGRDQGRTGAGPRQHPAAGQRLPAHDRGLAVRGVGVLPGICLGGSTCLKRLVLSTRRRDYHHRRSVTPVPHGHRLPGFGARARRTGRRLLLVVFLGLHRPAQGGGAPAPRHRRHLRQLRGDHAGHVPKTTCVSPQPSYFSPTGWATP